MSWLRSQGIESFRVLNPSWEIDVIDGSGIPLKPECHLDVVHRSDWARYRALHEQGGMYFDTDIIFTRPVPDEWLQHSLVLSKCHVACLGAEPRDRWFKLLDNTCADIYTRGHMASYQGYGINLALKMMENVRDQDVLWLDDDVILPVLANNTELLWNPSARPPNGERSIGVHWFGGDPLAQKMERIATEKWAATSECLVARAWQRLRANV
jgi:hypothetical protein